MQSNAIAVLLAFATLLALPATHRKWHRLEPCRADDLATIQARPVRTLIERLDGLVHSLQHFRLHLDQRKRQIFVGLGLERFAPVWSMVVGAGSFFANVAYPALNLEQQFTPMLHEHPPHVGTACGDPGCDIGCCTKHVAPSRALKCQRPSKQTRVLEGIGRWC